MKPYILTNNDFLNYFSKLPLKNKQYLIPTLNRDQINTISEVCKNFLSKILTTCQKVIRKVRKAKKEIKTVSLKKHLFIKRRKLYSPHQGSNTFSSFTFSSNFNWIPYKKMIMKEYILVLKHI